jgi:thioredoxin-related protein
MAKALLLLLLVFNTSQGAAPWLTDFEKARSEARQQGRSILLNFSGSDWCIPCIRLTKDVFEQAPFQQYAAANLVLVRADFPRLKKNQPAKDQVKHNEALAEKYNPAGVFPLTLLLNAEGKVLKRWEGDPKLTPDAFVEQVKSTLHDQH